MRNLPHVLIVFLILLLSACAVADVPAPTDTPPLTLAPPPTPVFVGICDNTPDLEAWSQTAYFLTTEFVEVMNQAAEQGRGEVYNEVIRMAELRDLMANAETPDCAVEAQNLLLLVMNDATTAFQSYTNNQLDNLADEVIELNARFEQAVAIQDELIVRLDNQAQAQP